MEFKLILKKLNNSLTKKEELTFLDWYNESEEHRVYFNNVKHNFLNNYCPVDAEKKWKELKTKIKSPRKRKNFYFVRYASVAMLLMAIGAFLYEQSKSNNSSNLPPFQESTIVSGTNKATLTLEDGIKIPLHKGKEYSTNNVYGNGEKLEYKKNPNVNKKETIYNYLTIPKGGQYFVKLSDGTKVWLNSESKLKYPVNFNHNKPRKVELIYGEAYFDVAQSIANQGKEFIVKTKFQEIVVLGTEFNVKAYPEDKYIATTLIEGSVALSNGIVSKHLTPGFQAQVSYANKSIDFYKVDVLNSIAWKNGFFSFENQSLDKMFITLGKWYDIKVKYENETKKKLRFSGVLKRTNNIEELLKIIQKTDKVNFKINGKQILVK